VLPLKDLNPARIRPVVTVALIAANLAVWIGYELAGGREGSIDELGFHPCEVNGSCPQVGQGWALTAFTSLFVHASWGHVLVNMLFLWIFGNNVEDALGHVRFLVFYVLGGLAAASSQAAVTLAFGAAGEDVLPNVGASGAVAAVLGAYVVLYPRALVLTWVFPIFFFPIPAVFFIGIWFVFQLLAGTASMTAPESGGGVAYFAHIGGFLFGALLIRVFTIGRPAATRVAA
jgi:membrane associated rhomboid family serine protease